MGGERYLLRNVSEEGIGVWIHSSRAFGLTPKTHVSGDIVIGEGIHPVTLEVVHSTKGYVGLKIMSSDPSLSQILKELLEPSVYATALTPGEGCGTEDSQSGHWHFHYNAGPAARLRFWIGRPGDVKGLQVCFLGRLVSREQFGPIRTGFVADEPGPLGHEELLLLHEHPDPDFVQRAGQFLASVSPPLPGALLWHFLESGEQVFLPEELLKRTGS